MADTGKSDEVKGRVKGAAGELMGDEKLKREGAIDKAAGKIKEGVEHAKEKLHDLIDRAEKKEE